MQPKSIHKPTRAENHRTRPSFPTSGDNFTTIINLDNQPDTLALLEAMEFLDDYTAAIAAFEDELERTGTP